MSLVKDEKEVRYKITSAEVDGENNSSNEKVIGTDVSDENGQEKLKYDLGVTPQNKTVVYTFEQVNYPVNYKMEISSRRMSLCNLLSFWVIYFPTPPSTARCIFHVFRVL